MNARLTNRTKVFYGIADLGISMLTASQNFTVLRYMALNMLKQEYSVKAGIKARLRFWIKIFQSIL